MRYVRPLMQVGPAAPKDALRFGPCWFTHAEVIRRDAPSEVVPADALTEAERARLQPRAPLPGLMGILNTTPDSFSDGGLHDDLGRALGHARAMIAAGAGIVDIGGESTRPGAEEVPVDEEIRRTAPVIEALRAEGANCLISIDTRKAAVAEAALAAGADIINDVSALSFDPQMAPLCARSGARVCLMHAQGLPQDMQNDPRYGDVLLEVYDALEARVRQLEALGVPRGRIMVDPGIGFGKTVAHNLALLARISLFHCLGAPVLLGVSRKRFIGTLSGAAEARDRAPGSIGAALAALGQGVQVLRVHDVPEHAQAIALWRACVAHPEA